MARLRTAAATPANQIHQRAARGTRSAKGPRKGAGPGRILWLAGAVLVMWLLAYALAILDRQQPPTGGFTYTRWDAVEDIAYPVFWPVYRLHRLLGGPRHARDQRPVVPSPLR